MAAIENNLPRLNEMIAKDKSCVHAKDSSDYTALHYAARAGFLDIMKALLDNGANPNAQTASGKVTPLHRAAYMGHIEAIKLLTSKYFRIPLNCNKRLYSQVHMIFREILCPILTAYIN